MEQKSNLRTVPSELTLRLLSAIFLIGVSLAGTFLGGWFFAILILIVSILMALEWHKLADADETIVFFLIQCAALIVSVVMAVSNYFALAILPLLFGAGLIYLVSQVPWIKAWVKGRAPLWSSIGCLYIGLPSIAMIWFREDPQLGFATVMYLYILTWSNDSAAYFGGKAIGGVKLLPSISPNKTWAGVVSGLLACIVVGWVFTVFYNQIDIMYITLVSLVLGIAVQLGDLTESAIKRNFGLKDTSTLIPGHGGILDRVDGMVFSVLLAALIALCIDSANPSAALLLNITIN